MRAMNAALANLSADPQIYVLVGDPLVRVAPPEPTLPAEIVQIQEEKIICRLDMPATTTGLIGICHSHLSTWIREGDCYLSSVELVGETRKLIDVEYLLLPSSRPDELLLILCSSFSLGPGSIYVTLTAQPPISSREAAMLEQCLTRIEHLTALSLFPHKLLGTQTELRNLVKNTLLFARAKHNVSAYQKAQQNKAKMLILLDKLQKETLASLLERLSQNTLAFTERYADQFLSTHCGWIEAVCTCGEPLHYRVLAHFIMRSIKRCIFLCPRCGIINDSPEDNEIFADIAGPITLSQHKPTTLLLRVQNTAEHNLICRVALGVEYSKFMPGGFTVEPSLVTLGIQAGGTETIPFGVTCNTDSPQGVYFLKAFVMYDMHLICLHRPFSIG
jgi:hypothetical protein